MHGVKYLGGVIGGPLIAAPSVTSSQICDPPGDHYLCAPYMLFLIETRVRLFIEGR